MIEAKDNPTMAGHLVWINKKYVEFKAAQERQRMAFEAFKQYELITKSERKRWKDSLQLLIPFAEFQEGEKVIDPEGHNAGSYIRPVWEPLEVIVGEIVPTVHTNGVQVSFKYKLLKMKKNGQPSKRWHKHETLFEASQLQQTEIPPGKLLKAIFPKKSEE